MAVILLLNFDPASATKLTEILRQKRHTVTVDSGGAIADTIQAIGIFDLVIVDVSDDSRDTWTLLERIRCFRRERGPKPMLLFVSRVYRGPRFELELERKGGRLVYVI